MRLYSLGDGRGDIADHRINHYEDRDGTGRQRGPNAIAPKILNDQVQQLVHA